MFHFLKGIGKRLDALRKNKSIWSLADQGVVSLGNFFTNILLARNLPTEDYGIYLLIYGVIIFANGNHTALIVYPLSVKGSVVETAELQKITTHYLGFTLVLAFISTVIVSVATIVLGKSHIIPLTAVALLFWQIQETVRRALMSHLRYSEVLWGDGLSYIGQALLVLFLAQQKWLSIESTFVAIALSSALAAAVQILQLQLRIMPLKNIWDSAAAAWKIGKWALVSNLINIINLNVTPWLLALSHGITETASVQAVINILGASHPILVSTNNLMIPSVAKANVEGGMKAVNKTVFQYAMQGGVILAPFYGVLLLFPRQTLEFIYGANSTYVNLENILRLFVLSYICLYISQIPSAILAGLEKSKAAVLGQIGSVASSICVGIPLTVYVGSIGTAIGSIVANIVRIVISSWQIRNLSKSFDQSS